MDRETAEAREGVEDAETAIMPRQEDIRNAEKARSTTSKPAKTIQEMFNAIGDSLSNCACSDDEQDEEEEEDKEDTELGKLSKDDEPGWVMGTMSKMVQHRMDSFRQKQMRLDKLMQPGQGEAADYFREREIKYGMTKWIVLAIMKAQTETPGATPLLTTFGKLMQTYDIVPGQ